MRIKSYFAASVQSAIATARRESGDNVTLVTSHIAAGESRHLGEYEVVFAVEEGEREEKAAPIAAQSTAFQEVLLDAVAKKPITAAVLERVETLRSDFVELKIDSEMVRILMTLIARSLGSTTPSAAKIPEEKPERAAPKWDATPRKRNATAAALTDLSDAEQAFLLSVKPRAAGDRS